MSIKNILMVLLVIITIYPTPSIIAMNTENNTHVENTQSDTQPQQQNRLGASGNFIWSTIKKPICFVPMITGTTTFVSLFFLSRSLKRPNLSFFLGTTSYPAVASVMLGTVFLVAWQNGTLAEIREKLSIIPRWWGPITRMIFESAQEAPRNRQPYRENDNQQPIMPENKEETQQNTGNSISENRKENQEKKDEGRIENEKKPLNSNKDVENNIEEINLITNEDAENKVIPFENNPVLEEINSALSTVRKATVYFFEEISSNPNKSEEDLKLCINDIEKLANACENPVPLMFLNTFLTSIKNITLNDINKVPGFINNAFNKAIEQLTITNQIIQQQCSLLAGEINGLPERNKKNLVKLVKTMKEELGDTTLKIKEKQETLTNQLPEFKRNELKSLENAVKKDGLFHNINL